MPLRFLEGSDHAGKRVLQGVVLAMAGLVASVGVSAGCLVRNLILWPEAFSYRLPGLGSDGGEPPMIHSAGGRMPGTGVEDLVMVVVFLVLMLLWMGAVAVFVRQRPRAALTYFLFAGIAGVFLWSSWNVWRIGYPVCNAF